MIMDKFLEWLNKNKDHYALIDKSYKNVLPEKEIKVNTELATYGDAVLKLALCQILWCNNISKFTEKKKKYEEDETLVKIIAKNYKLLDFIKFENTKPKDYNYLKSNTKKNGKNTHKFIATAVEACLGAIYDEEKNMAKVIEIVQLWKDMVDKSCNE